MGKRSDILVSIIRSQSENDLANSAVDITDTEILQYLNEGASRIQNRIIAQNPRVFIGETTVTPVGGQEEYSLPSDCVFAGRILSVEYAPSSVNPAYNYLIATQKRPTGSHISGIPRRFMRQDKLSDSTGSFLVFPKPASNSGQFRVRYIRRVDNLDIRRAVVLSTTYANGTISALTLDTSGVPGIDVAEFAKNDFMCVNSKLGVINMRNIQFDSVDEDTGVVTISSGFTYETGETITAGDYITLGKNSTTHSQFDESVEKYLIAFALYKMFKKDSSIDLREQKSELTMIESEILESYQDIDEDEPEFTSNWSETL